MQRIHELFNELQKALEDVETDDMATLADKVDELHHEYTDLTTHASR